MDTINAINEILNNRDTKTAKEITALVDEKLSEPGSKGVKESWENTRVNPNCNNPGNVEAQTCYRVNHGDGTYSPIWCDDWHCV